MTDIGEQDNQTDDPLRIVGLVVLLVFLKKKAAILKILPIIQNFFAKIKKEAVKNNDINIIMSLFI